MRCCSTGRTASRPGGRSCSRSWICGKTTRQFRSRYIRRAAPGRRLRTICCGVAAGNGGRSHESRRSNRMSRPVIVSPSILSADFGRLAEEVRAVDAAGADYIHVDVMDGRFVPNLTIGPVVVAAVRKATKLPLDVHLMIEDPDRYVEDFARAGADLIGVHVEACRHLHRVLQQIRAAGKRASVTLNPHSGIETISYVLENVDQVLIMSVNPGFGGQSF